MTTPARSKSIGGVRHYPNLAGHYVPSVTAVLNRLDMSVEGLISWASNIGVQVGMEMSDRDYTDVKRIAHARRRESAERGTTVHEILEQHMAGTRPIVDIDNEPWLDGTLGFVKAGLRFLDDHVARIVAVEMTMIGDTYAGSCDLVAELRDGRIACIDWKTGKQYSKHLLQIAAYWAADLWVREVDGEWEQVPTETPQTGVCVYLHDDGTYDAIDVINIRDAWVVFSDCVTILLDTIKANDLLKNAVQSTVLVVDGAMQAPAAPSAVEPVASSASPVPTLEQRRAWVKARVEALGDLAIELTPSGWPDGQRVGTADGDTLDAMAAACTVVEGRHVLPLPDPDPATDLLAADDDRVQVTIALTRSLPADLLDVVQQHIVMNGIPRMSSGRCTEAQVMEVRSWVESMHVEHSARVAIVREAAERVAKVTDIDTLCRLAGVDNITVTEDDVERVVALVAGIELGVVVLDVDDDLTVVARVDSMTVETMFGGKRDLVRVAKDEADRLGLARPRTAADVHLDPILAGAAAAKGAA